MTWRLSEETLSQPLQKEQAPAPDQVFAPGPLLTPPPLPTKPNRRPQPGRGRRSQVIATGQGGTYVRAIIPQGTLRDIALDATLRAAAFRKATTTPLKVSTTVEFTTPLQDLPAAIVTPGDLRVKLRRTRVGNLILFLVDASGSMGARKRMVAVKGAILSLLLAAYQKRDRVGLITFRGSGARLLVPPTNSVELAERQLRQLPTGGQTPLAAGLRLADQVLTAYLQRDAALTPLLVLITDGRANLGPPVQLRQVTGTLAQKKLAALVLDSEQGFVRLGLARELAVWLNAQYLPLDELRAETIVSQVRQKLPGIRMMRDE